MPPASDYIFVNRSSIRRKDGIGQNVRRPLFRHCPLCDVTFEQKCTLVSLSRGPLNAYSNIQTNTPLDDTDDGVNHFVFKQLAFTSARL